MKREIIDYLQDIYTSILDLEEFVAGMEEEHFITDKKTVYASVKCFEVMGEAVTKIPASFRKRYPRIPWQTIAGMQNKLVHEYFGVDKSGSSG